MAEEKIVGILELIGEKKFGFVREWRHDIPKGDDDPFMPPPMIKRFRLNDGVLIEGWMKPGRKGARVISKIDRVMGLPIDEWQQMRPHTTEHTIYPDQKFNLITSSDDIDMRVVDIAAPLGKGQRALIVSPPRCGKTVLLRAMARAMAANHPEVVIIALLVDERPEEVTDFKRTTPATVFASSNDRDEDNHVRVATLCLEYALRHMEMRRDVVLFLDSLTRLGRTFNLYTAGSGRTMSGGLDSRALNIPRKIFGAAKNVENGGSLTIIATALIETGSRMDEVILEEFKGTGNAEIVLDREMANKRIYPAVNLRKSGTRNEDRLLGDMTYQYHRLMRALNSRHPVEATKALIRQIKKTPDNDTLLNELVPGA